MMNFNFSWEDLPFANQLRSHQNQRNMGLHMPGHGDTSCFHPEFRQYMPFFDTTELEGTDNLNDPQEALQLSQAKAAKCWGAKHTYFVTSGSSTAIKAAVLGLSSLFQAKEIFCPRTVHQSFLHACALAQLRPIFLPLKGEETTGDRQKSWGNAKGQQNYAKDAQGQQNCAKNVKDVKDVKDVKGQPINTSPLGRPHLNKWAELFAKAKPFTPVFLTSPDYFGSSYELKEVIDLAHRHQLLVIVDQAHGAHFAFCPWQKHLNAPTAGADLSIHSLHKTLPALTPAALLHLGTNLESFYRKWLDGQCSTSLAKATKSTVNVATISVSNINVDRVSAQTSNIGTMSAQGSNDSQANDLVAYFQHALQMMQTTSPSFMIGASIDYAVSFVKQMPPAFWEEKRLSLHDLATELREMGFTCFATEALRLVVDVSAFAPAEHCAQILQNHGIEIEMHDWLRLVLLFPLNYERSWHAKILEAFASICRHPYPWADSKWQSAHHLRELTADYYAFLLEVPHTPSQPPQCQAILAKDLLIPYPPGIPIRWPQEVWQESDFLRWEKLYSRLFS